MNNRPRRQKPTSRADRKRVAELNRIVANSRTSRADRETALTELDRLARFASEVGTPIQTNPPAEDTSVEKEPLSEGTSVPPPAPELTLRGVKAEPVLVDWVEHCSPDMEEKLPAIDVRCLLLLTMFQIVAGAAPLSCFRSEQRMGDLFGCPHFTMDDLDQIEKSFTSRFGEIPTFLPARERCRDNKFAVLRRDSMTWFRSQSPDEQKRLFEVFQSSTKNGKLSPDVARLYDKMKADFLQEEVIPQKSEPVRAVSSSLLSDVPEPEDEAFNPTLKAKATDPIAAAAVNLSQRAEIALNSDAFLSALANHNGGILRSKILAEIHGQLLTMGNADAAYLARLCNTLRPRGLSRFPERRF